MLRTFIVLLHLSVKYAQRLATQAQHCAAPTDFAAWDLTHTSTVPLSQE